MNETPKPPIDITTLAWESPAPPDALPFDWRPYTSEENWLAFKAVFPRNFREQDHLQREEILRNFMWPLIVLFPNRIAELEPNHPEDHTNIAGELASQEFNPYRLHLSLFLKTVWPQDTTPVAHKALAALEKRAATGEWTDTVDPWNIKLHTTLDMAAHAKILDPENFSRLAISQAAWDELEKTIIKKDGVDLAEDRRNKFWLVSTLALVKILSPDLYSKIALNANEWAETKRDIERRIRSSSYTTQGMLTYITHAAICAARKVECTGNGRLKLVTEEPAFTAQAPPMPPMRRF